MPLNPNEWPLPYTATYSMVLNQNGNPSHYTITLKDNSTGATVSGQTTQPDPLELNLKIRELANQLYP